MDILLARLSKKDRPHTSKIINEGADLTIDTTETQKILRDYYEQ